MRLLGAIRLRMDPKETCEGSGISRKAGAGTSEAIRRGHFFFSSVIDPLHEPFVAAEVVEQLAEQRAVEKRLPVFAHDRLLPPLGLDLPPRDRIDGARPRPRHAGR